MLFQPPVRAAYIMGNAPARLFCLCLPEDRTIESGAVTRERRVRSPAGEDREKTDRNIARKNSAPSSADHNIWHPLLWTHPTALKKL